MTAFEELGIGVDGIREHDFGMDVLLHPRNAALIDLGVFATAQIKSGRSWFDEEIRSPTGDVIGWWFRSDERHLEYWRQTALPHLVILHDPVLEVSYWRRVRMADAERTGKDWRIEVPADQTIDPAHHAAVLEDLASGTGPMQLEGSVWRRPQPLDPADTNWRFALCAPRLVAPHRNAGFTQPLGPMATAAMLVQFRLRDLDTIFESHSTMPTLEDAANHRLWGWRFVHALFRWLVHDEPTSLIKSAHEADKPADRAAAIAAAAVALRYADGADEALRFIRVATRSRRFAPIDRGWVDIHRARLLLEVGDEAGALRAAGTVRSQLEWVRDPMAAALRGAAAAVVWEAGSWGAQDLEQVIRDADNALGWWRSQVLASVGVELLLRDVEQWARARDRFTMEDEALNGVASVTSTSLFVGDSAAAHRYLGQYLLVTAETPEEAADALDRLIVAGDSRAVALGVGRCAESPLMTGVTLAARRRRGAWWTRRSIEALMQFVTVGADLFDRTTADALLGDVLAVALDPDAPQRKAAPRGTDIEFYALRAAARLLPAASRPAHRRAARRLLTTAVERSPLASTALRDLVAALDWSALSRRARKRLLDLAAAEEDDATLNIARAAAAASGDTVVRDAISVAGRDGDLRLLAAAATRGLTPRSQDAAAVVTALTTAVEQVRDASSRGLRHLGAGDPLHLLAWLCFTRPRHAKWDAVAAAIADPQMLGYQVTATLRYLVANRGRIPSPVLVKLGGATARFNETSPIDAVLREDPRGYALALRAHARLIDRSEYETTVHCWLASGDAALAGAAADAAVYGPTNYVRDRRGLAIALRMSDDPAVRSAGVAVALKRPPVVPVAEFLTATEREGRLFAHQLAVSLRQLDTEATRQALPRLARHPSARVRQAATGAVD